MIPAEGLFVIDNPLQTELLIAKLKAAVPLSATVSRPLLALLQEQSPDIALPPRCQITGIHYTGDEGGILCKLDFGHEDGRIAAWLTHIPAEVADGVSFCAHEGDTGRRHAKGQASR